MKLTLALFAFCVFAQSPGITDAQRIKYREMERDYYRLQATLAGLQQQIQAQHEAFEQTCGGPVNDTTLTCKERSERKPTEK